jgi:hypothetical protein
MTHFSG